MSSFGFEVAHGYQILKGYVSAENIKEAKQKILNEDWDDVNIVDEYDTDYLTEGYEIIDIWR